jgi:hypothetical protein
VEPDFKATRRLERILALQKLSEGAEEAGVVILPPKRGGIDGLPCLPNAGSHYRAEVAFVQETCAIPRKAAELDHLSNRPFAAVDQTLVLDLQEIRGRNE